MKKSTVALLFMTGMVAALHAELPRLAVADFSVQSDNPRLKYVGKGLSEMVAIELASSRGLVLIEREQRAQLLGEQEFSLSAAADSNSQIQIGRLLSASYLLFGSVLDMDSALLVTCKIVKVETGEIVWNDKYLGPLADYDGISRKLAFSALAGLGVGGTAVAIAPLTQSTATVAANPGSGTATAGPAKPALPPPSPSSRESVILDFSSALEHFDKKEFGAAIVDLRSAKAQDPGNAAVSFYLAKLTGNSPRFQVDLERYAPIYNPASLGLLDQGSIYAWVSNSNTIGSLATLTTSIGDWMWSFDIISGLDYSEDFGKWGLGFTLPLGTKLGLTAEAELAGHRSDIFSIGNYDITGKGSFYANLGNVSYGGLLGFGYQVLPGLSLGAEARVTKLASNQLGASEAFELTAMGFNIFPEAAATYYGATAGLAYRSEDKNVEANFEAVWSNQAEFYLVEPVGGFTSGNPGTMALGAVPIVLSTGATMGFLDRSLFASMQGVLERGFDPRSIFAIRLVPGAEWWVTKWLSLRAAYEFDYLSANTGIRTASTSGNGVMGGTTVLLGAWELTLNLEARYLPLRDLPGNGSYEFAFLGGIVWHGLGERK